MPSIHLKLKVRIVACHGGRDGQGVGARQTVGSGLAIVAEAAPAEAFAQTPGWPSAIGRSGGIDRHPLRAQDRHPLGVSAGGDELRQRHELLAAPARLASRGCVAEAAREAAVPVARRGMHRLFTRGGGLRLGASRFGGAKTGPNPTDRRKSGSKHHVLTDANGTPMTMKLTGANRHDVTQLLPLVDSVPAIGCKPGRPRRRFEQTQGDRAYDSQPHRRELRKRHTRPVLARRRSGHGSGLGKHRWVVERTLSWVHQNRRLRVRYEKRDDTHETFMILSEGR